MFSRPAIKKELRCEQQHIILAKPLDRRTLREFRVQCVQRRIEAIVDIICWKYTLWLH